MILCLQLFQLLALHAKGVSLQIMLEGTKQYVIPLFQRPYSWEQREWSDLWDDIIEIYAMANPREHFIGSIVTLPFEPTPAGVSKFTLIDGQQRMTTLLMLLSAIRDVSQRKLASHDADEELKGHYKMLPEEINESYIFNKFAEDNDRYKLMPSELDRGSFESVMKGEESPTEGRVDRCKKWFVERLEEGGDGKDYDLKSLKTVTVTKLVLVSIELEKDENPYLIFETLNARGTPLTEADLVRNFLFMRMSTDRKKQEVAYRQKWLPMQQELTDAYLTPFFGHFMMKDYGFIRKNEVYFTMKGRYGTSSTEEVFQLLEMLALHAKFYRKLLDPNLEESGEVRDALIRLKGWEVTTAYPLLLKLYGFYSAGAIDSGELGAGAQICRVLRCPSICYWIFIPAPEQDLFLTFQRTSEETRFSYRSGKV